mmetsp:Transcript_71653/g.213855  ORF Transcript_71653/g.213855 Transcript_71653/m.213855 type:complete len:213 (-) Transcript_71653:222-860(-)
MEPTPLAFLKQWPPLLSDTVLGHIIILKGTGRFPMRTSKRGETMTWSFDCNFFASTVQLTQVCCPPAVTRRLLLGTGRAVSSWSVPDMMASMMDGGSQGGGGGVATCPRRLGKTCGLPGARALYDAGKSASTAGSAGFQAKGCGIKRVSRPLGTGNQRGSMAPGQWTHFGIWSSLAGLRLAGTVPSSSSRVPSLSLGASVSTSAHVSELLTF